MKPKQVISLHSIIKLRNRCQLPITWKHLSWTEGPVLMKTFSPAGVRYSRSPIMFFKSCALFSYKPFFTNRETLLSLLQFIPSQRCIINRINSYNRCTQLSCKVTMFLRRGEKLIAALFSSVLNLV